MSQSLMPRKTELPLIEMGKTVGGARLKDLEPWKIKNSVFDVLTLRYISYI